jgi:hypothetical protein
LVLSLPTHAVQERKEDGPHPGARGQCESDGKAEKEGLALPLACGGADFEKMKILPLHLTTDNTSIIFITFSHVDKDLVIH